MDFHYDIKNKKLKKLVEKKAEELGIPVQRLIWNYINRGIMGDSWNEDLYEKLNSEEFLKEVNDALNVD